MDFFISILWMPLVFTGNFMSLQSSLFEKSLSAFVILAGSWSAGFKYVTKHYLRHSLSSKYWILINRFWYGLIHLEVLCNCY